MSDPRPREARPSFGAARLVEETRERFVREIVARVPLARLVELHVFAPMRQGGVESGVAVLAALPDVPPAPDAAPDATPDALPVEVAREVALDAAAAAAAPAPAEAERCDPTDAAAGPPPEVAPEAEPGPAPAARGRHTVFTALYRLVLKGPERGKWEVEVREEADAPLITVDAVVRGVQTRSGEAGDPERLDAPTVARLLGATG